MRRWLVCFLALLVTAQMSWAATALCCIGELPGQPPASGETSALIVTAESAHAAQSADAAHLCEAGHCHCHHAGCATPLADAAGMPSGHGVSPTQALTPAHKSHIPAGLERPNWQRA